MLHRGGAHAHSERASSAHMPAATAGDASCHVVLLLVRAERRAGSSCARAVGWQLQHGASRRRRRRRCAPRGGWRSRTRSTPCALPDPTQPHSRLNSRRAVEIPCGQTRNFLSLVDCKHEKRNSREQPSAASRTAPPELCSPFV
eukprot:3833297-Prymnesium_polylepis.4